MTDNIFETTKRLISARTAAEYYGFQPNRANFIQCPFHTEKTASLKLYGNNWHCFGCGLGGSSIDFVAKLFDLSPLNAVRKMNVDFDLALPLDKPPSTAQKEAARHRKDVQSTEQEFDKEQNILLSRLNAAYRIGHDALQNFTSFDYLSEAEVLAIQWLEALEEWTVCLLSGNMKEEMKVFRDRRAIRQLCGKILNNSTMKSGTV